MSLGEEAIQEMIKMEHFGQLFDDWLKPKGEEDESIEPSE